MSEYMPAYTPECLGEYLWGCPQTRIHDRTATVSPVGQITELSTLFAFNPCTCSICAHALITDRLNFNKNTGFLSFKIYCRAGLPIHGQPSSLLDVPSLVWASNNPQFYRVYPWLSMVYLSIGCRTKMPSSSITYSHLAKESHIGMMVVIDVCPWWFMGGPVVSKPPISDGESPAILA